MRKILPIMIFAILFHVAAPAKADTTFAQPEPSFDNPRKIVISLHERDFSRVNEVLYNVVNIQKAYGQDSVQLEVVAYGPGIWAVLKDSPVRARIESLQKYGIVFVACGNTLDTIKRPKSDLIEGVKWVQSGLVEIIERRLAGWVDIAP